MIRPGSHVFYFLYAIPRTATRRARLRLLLSRLINLNGPWIRLSRAIKYLHSREDAVGAIKNLSEKGFAKTNTTSELEALSAATSCLHVHELKEVLSTLKIRTLAPNTKPRMIEALTKAMKTRRTLFGTKLPLGEVLKKTMMKNSDMLIRLDDCTCKMIRLCTHRYYISQDPSLWDVSNICESKRILKTRPHPFGLLERFGKIIFADYAVISDRESRGPICLSSTKHFEMYLVACEIRLLCEKWSTESSKSKDQDVLKKMLSSRLNELRKDQDLDQDVEAFTRSIISVCDLYAKQFITSKNKDVSMMTKTKRSLLVFTSWYVLLS